MSSGNSTQMPADAESELRWRSPLLGTTTPLFRRRISIFLYHERSWTRVKISGREQFMAELAMILLVEDREDDIVLIQSALRKGRWVMTSGHLRR
jgi:hypothetical protein